MQMFIKDAAKVDVQFVTIVDVQLMFILLEFALVTDSRSQNH